MKKIIFIIILLVSVHLNAQTSFQVPKKYFYLGADVGVSLIRSAFEYDKAYPELNSEIQYSRTDWLHSRLQLGYTINIHRIEFSIQNLPIRTGYTLKYSENSNRSEHLRKGATLFSFSYLIQPYKIKWFSFNLGPHIGVAFAGNSDFGDYEKRTYATTIDNVVVETALIERTTIRKHQIFLNLGARFNLLFEVSPKVELLLNTSVLYTPYQVRGFEVNYQRNNDALKTVQSFNKVLNYTIGIGLNYRFFRKNKKAPIKKIKHNDLSY